MAARAEAAEPALAAIWAEVLDVEHVKLDDDFFELGGTSLLAMQIVARASDALGVEIALDALFETPTVAGLAQRIDEAKQPSPTAATRARGRLSASNRLRDAPLSARPGRLVANTP